MLAIILFHSKSNIIWTKFLGSFKHVSCLCFDDYRWINFDCSWPLSHVRYAVLNQITPEGLLDGFRANPNISAFICLDVDDLCVKRRWYLFMINSCVEIIKRICNIDVGFTATPHRLLKKIILFNAKRNYNIIGIWRRDYGTQ